MSAAVLTVSQVTRYIKSLLEGDRRLSDVILTGEISNFTDHYRSGHLYFSLKDEGAVLKSVMFAGSAKRLKFRPQEGMKVIARGKISVYEPSGQYQLYVENMQPDGVGALTVAFEQLKRKLEAEGLFDQEYKRPLPAYPQRIGVVTSPTGAAVQDILQITRRRWPVAEIVFCPVLVQGENAAPQMVKALRALNREEAADVIILGRGGGSLEDLWAFNDEELAREVFASEIPVISAVGHETDFTICDFAADLRAPTPSAAAELCTPDLQEELGRLRDFREYFTAGARQWLETRRQKLDLLLFSFGLKDPQVFLRSWRERLQLLTARLEASGTGRLQKEKERLSLLSASLDQLSPLKVLGRGFALVQNEKGEPVTDASRVSLGDSLEIRLLKGKLKALVTEGGNIDGTKEKL